MKLLHAFDTDHIGTGALDAGSHAVEEVGKIHNMRLLRRILNDGIALGKCSRHDHVNGCTHRHHIHIDMASEQLVGLRNHHAGRCHPYIGSERTESLYVLINRAQPDIAAARKCYLRLLVLAKKRADQIVRSADLSNGFRIHRLILNKGTVDHIGMQIRMLYDTTDLRNRSGNGANIRHVRNIFNCNRLICHDRGRNDRKSSVLRSPDLNLSAKRRPAFHNVMQHAPFSQTGFRKHKAPCLSSS